MRAVGIVIFLAGAAAAAWAMRGSFGDNRARSLLFGVGSAVAVLLALVGLLLVLVPGFF